jgi:hypothetical protein
MPKKIKDITTKVIDVDKLYFQYIPEKFFKEIYPGDEKQMLSLENCPHYKFLLLYRKIGKAIWKCYRDTDYVKLQRLWGRDDKYSRKKAVTFIKTYKDIKKNGLKKRIVVLDKPMHKQFFVDGYEIYHGHHRAAICKVLGFGKIKCIISKLM